MQGNYKSWFSQKREKLGRNWSSGNTNKENLNKLIKDVINNAERIITDICRGNINLDVNSEDMYDLISPAILDSLIQFCAKRNVYAGLIYKGLSQVREGDVNNNVPSSDELLTALSTSSIIAKVYYDCWYRFSMFKNTHDITQIIMLQNSIRSYNKYICLSKTFTI